MCHFISVYFSHNVEDVIREKQVGETDLSGCELFGLGKQTRGMRARLAEIRATVKIREVCLGATVLSTRCRDGSTRTRPVPSVF